MRLGRYVLGPSLGRGGMGEVFEGWDSLLCRRVAVKVMHFGDVRTITRFMQEAQLQAKANHPNLCRIFDVDLTEGRPFIAMQLIQGPALDQIADSIPIGEVARLFKVVAEAIHAAHRVKLIHRDLKPSNILLEGNPEGGWNPIVCDFSLAMELGEPGLTLSHAQVGTPAYMAPEQVRGDRSQVGPAADVYGLGATFYSVLLGRPPYIPEGGKDLLADKLERKFPKPRALKPGIPRDLEIILLKCLEPEPRDRYASAAALAEDLRRFLEGESIVARPAGPLVHGLRLAERNPRVAATLTVSLLATLLASGWGLQIRSQSRIQMESAQRFGALAKDLEHLLRMERMLPPHDLRPLREHTLRRMGEVRGSLFKLGTEELGPARLALARGHLALHQPDAALAELDAAWVSGYRTQDMAYALARTHCEAYEAKADREVLELGESTLEMLRERHLKMARQYIDQAGAADWEPLVLGEAVLLNLEGRYPEALERCRHLAAKDPWLYEAKAQEAEAWVGMGFQAQMSWDGKRADECYAAADRAIRSAMLIGRSDDGIFQTALNHRLARVGAGNLFGIPGSSQLKEISGWVETALAIGPDNPRAWADKLTLRIREVEWRISAGQNPTAAIQEALGWVAELHGPPMLLAVGAQKAAWLHLLQADWDEASGKDPRLEIEKALACQPVGYRGMLASIRRAESAKSRNEDPSPWVSQAAQFRKTIKLPDFWFGAASLTAHGHSLLAAWKISQGEDPTVDLQAAGTELETALKDPGNNPIPSAYLAELCGLRLASGIGEPADTLRKGGEATRMLLALSGTTFRDLGGIANLGLVVTQWAQRGERHLPSWVAGCKKALRQGRIRYPGCLRLRWIEREWGLVMPKRGGGS